MTSKHLYHAQVPIYDQCMASKSRLNIVELVRLDQLREKINQFKIISAPWKRRIIKHHKSDAWCNKQNLMIKVMLKQFEVQFINFCTFSSFCASYKWLFGHRKLFLAVHVCTVTANNKMSWMNECMNNGMTTNWVTQPYEPVR